MRVTNSHYRGIVLVALTGTLLVGCRPSPPHPTQRPATVAMITSSSATATVGTIRTARPTALAIPTAPTVPPRVPQFNPGPCLTAYPADPNWLECGSVVVPELHSAPNGRTISLAVARIRRRDGGADPDPVIYLQGGPGFAGLSALAAWASALATTHDVITFDQRGTGYSQPLACPEIQTQYRQDQTVPLDPRTERNHFVAAALQCRDRLVRAGFNLAAFTTQENAADINDIREAFGYDRLSLVGDSYGTTLALVVMHDFPQGVRTVALDSVAPPQIDAFAEAGANFDHALTVDFTACAQQGCTPSVAALRNDLETVVAHLDRQPISLSTRFGIQAMTGSRLLLLIQALLYAPDGIAKVPSLIENLKRGDDQLLISAAAVTTPWPLALTMGMHISMVCSQRTSPDSEGHARTAAHGALPAIRDAFVGNELFPLPDDLCRQWFPIPIPPAQYEAVTSDIPTLMLESANDPVTPPAYRELVAQTLAHRFTIETPGIGHGPGGTTCGKQLIAAFLAQPEEKPDTSCLADLGVTYLPAP